MQIIIAAVKEILLFIIACYGMTSILCYSKVTAFLRDKLVIPYQKSSYDGVLPCSAVPAPHIIRRPLGGLLKCPMCTGFWVGMLLHGMAGLDMAELGQPFVGGLISAGTSYLLCMVVDDNGWRTNKNANHERK